MSTGLRGICGAGGTKKQRQQAVLSRCFIGSGVLFYKICRRAQNAKQSTMSDRRGLCAAPPLSA